MDIVTRIERNKIKRVISVLLKGKSISILSPYFLKMNAFHNENGNALKFADEVDPLNDEFVRTGDFFKAGYEQGWMLEGKPNKLSMCSIKCKNDFITRWQYTTKKIVTIDRANQHFDTVDETTSFEEKISDTFFICSYASLVAELRNMDLSYEVTEEGTFSLVEESNLNRLSLACI